jgi:hypothetical protein
LHDARLILEEVTGIPSSSSFFKIKICVVRIIGGVNCEVLKLKMELPNKIDGLIDSNTGPLILELFPIGCWRYNRYENSIFYLSPIYIFP